MIMSNFPSIFFCPESKFRIWSVSCEISSESQVEFDRIVLIPPVKDIKNNDNYWYTNYIYLLGQTLIVIQYFRNRNHISWYSFLFTDLFQFHH